MLMIRFMRRKGSAAIEFAIVGPVMILLLMGMVVYGGWFWLAQSVQTLATESARAAVGGLDAAEQERLARDFITREAQAGAGLDPAALGVSVSSDTTAIRVQVSFDVSHHPLMAMAAVLPPPPSVIRRTAVVRTGGY